MSLLGGVGLRRALMAPRRVQRYCWTTGTGFDFSLDKNFVKSFERRPNPFGFNGLGEVVYLRTYSRVINEEESEKWFQTVERVVNGTFSIQKQWLQQNKLPWNEEYEQRQAMEMYERMYSMKFLPPGRGLWAMGSSITTDRNMFAALNNCAFVSTSMIDSNGIEKSDPTDPFCFLMDAAMLGVGVGFDTLGAGSVHVYKPITHDSTNAGKVFVVPDSREGWVLSLRELLNVYLHPHHSHRQPLPIFDYSLVRPAGSPIRGFGGTSQGPRPLQDLHCSLIDVLDKCCGSPLTATTIVDIMNLIGKCVVAGNVRRTAEIAFGDPNSDEYINLKNYEKNPHRREFGWTSNNSVFANLGMEYSQVCEQICNNGEPGFAWLENMQAFSRMNGQPDFADRRAKGGNPCLEQTLESYEMCCLVETFPAKHSSLSDFLITLRTAFLYAKIVTLVPTHWPASNLIMKRNRRVGTSLSGIAQFLAAPGKGISALHQWCCEGYNELKRQDIELSEKFGVPVSVKTTCIKPSGTVSLLAGATPGMHFPESRYYIRRVRLSKESSLVGILQQTGFNVEPAVDDVAGTVVVDFPIDVGEGVRTLDDVGLWEQLGLAAFLQKYWADNQVSCTVTFDPDTEGKQLPHALDLFQYQLKGISFLPRKRVPSADPPYPQMPYENISRERYDLLMKALDRDQLRKSLSNNTMLKTSFLSNNDVPDKFCDSSACSMASSENF